MKCTYFAIDGGDIALVVDVDVEVIILDIRLSLPGLGDVLLERVFLGAILLLDYLGPGLQLGLIFAGFLTQVIGGDIGFFANLAE